MRIFTKIKFSVEDLLQKICVNKWKSIVCAVAAIAGLVVGAVFVNVFSYSWWYENRCNYAYSLFEGGFGLFFSFLLWTTVFYLCIVCCQIVPRFKYFSCAVLFAACFYVGANTAAAVICWSMWGILFALLVSLAEAVGYWLACISCCCLPAAYRTFKEAICDTKQSLAILLASLLIKILTFFVILRLLTAVI